MAKIMFIVNEHPNEAFAITVARKTAEILRKKGNEILWHKVEPEHTILGKVSKTTKKIELGSTDSYSKLLTMNEKAKEESLNEVVKVVREKNPAFIYRFHCTGEPAAVWRDHGNADLSIEEDNSWGRELLNRPLRVIEIKAVYKPIAKKMRKRINAAFAKGPKAKAGDGQRFYTWIDERDLYEQYLTKTTSQGLSRTQGLAPEEFARSIAENILKDIESGGKLLKRYIPSSGYYTRGIFGKIKRIKEGEQKMQRRPLRIAMRLR